MSTSQLQLAPIGGLIEKVASWNPVRDAPEDEITYIDLSAVDNSTKTVRNIQFLQGRDAPSRARQRVKSGDVLVSTVRPNLNGVARVPEEFDGATASTGFCVLRPKPLKLDGSYLFHWVRSSEFVADMVRKATGASYPAISDKIIAQSKIPLPLLEEQKRIAAILDQADELRRKRQRALDRLGQLGQAIFIEMFGDISQLPRTHAFDEIAKIQQSLVDPKLPQYHSELHVGPEHLASGAGVVNWEAVRTAQEDAVISGKNRFERGDILYSKIRPYLNKVALADRPGICSADMYVIQPIEQESTAHFLRMLLMGSDFLAYAETCSNRANIPKLNRKQVEGYRFYGPPIDDQRKFADRLNNLDVMGNSYTKAADASSNLFASLQHRAFRREL